MTRRLARRTDLRIVRGPPPGSRFRCNGQPIHRIGGFYPDHYRHRAGGAMEAPSTLAVSPAARGGRVSRTQPRIAAGF